MFLPCEIIEINQAMEKSLFLYKCFILLGSQFFLVQRNVP